jgi:ankyrin repeat protein
MRKDFVWTNEKAQSLGYRLEGPMVSLVNTFNEAIRLIFERYPSLVRSSDFKGQTPLMLAINDELSDIASTCIELGADVNDQDFKGRTALHTAAVTGDLATFKQLLSKRADPGLRTVDGMNVLHTAVRMGRPAMVELVLNERPHLATMEDDYGMTPILWSEEPADKMSAQMRIQFGRNPGSIADYKAVHHLLSNVV